MRRYCSAAALCLRLVWLRALGACALVAVIQWMMALANKPASVGFSTLLENGPATVGMLGFALLTLVFYYTLTEHRGNRMGYTLQRLSIPDWQLALVWSLVLAGFFLIYWVSQLAVVVLLFRRWAALVEAGQNLLFVSAFRAGYFHYLLPLAEPWGWARNIAVCLSLGSASALSAHNSRHQRFYPLLCGVLLLIWMNLKLSHEMASQAYDMGFVAYAAFHTGLDWFMTWRWMHDEEKN